MLSTAPTSRRLRHEPSGPPRPRPHLPAPRDRSAAERAREHAGRCRHAPGLGPHQVDPADQVDHELLERVGLSESPTCASTSSPPARAGSSSWVGRWHAHLVLLLDEPSPGSTTTRPSASRPCCASSPRRVSAVLLVEHDMSFVMRRVPLHQRARLRPDHRARARPTRSESNAEVQRAYLGTAAGRRVIDHTNFDGRRRARRDTRARAARCAPAYGRIDVLHGVDLCSQRARSTPCSGRTAPARSPPSRWPPARSCRRRASVLLCWTPDVNGATSDALARAGVCLVPEGRGIFPNLTVTENLRMATYTGTRSETCEDGVSYPRFPGSGRAPHARPPAPCPAASSRCSPWRRALATDPAAAAPRRAVDGARAR